jgi:EmrB/QacA subfamily drug resistance transporter
MRSLAILGIAALAFAMGQTTIIPALGDMMRAFDTDTSGIAWTVTGYLVSAAVFTPIMGRLGDMFGKRRMLVFSMGMLAFGSAISALGYSLEVVVIGRVLQGIGGGIFPLCFGIIRDEFPRERVPGSIGLISATAGIGGGVGLVAGGLVVQHSSYHWIFWMSVILCLIGLIATQLFVPESPNTAPGRVDVRGAIVLAVGLVLPLYAISRAQDWGWTSGRLLGMTAAGLLVLTFWVWLERRTKEPLANMRTLGRPAVLMTNITTLLVGFGMFGSFVVLPELAQLPKDTGYGFGLDAFGAALLLLPGSLVMLVAGPISGQLAARFGGKLPLLFGAIISGIGLILVGVEHSTQGWVITFQLVQSIGIGLAYAAMPNLIVAAVPQEQTGEATGFNALVRAVGSSLGSQVSASLVAASVVSGSTVPSDSGFTTAFVVSGVIAACAGIAAVAIPSRRAAAAAAHHPDSAETLAEVGAAGPLADPALAGEER